MKINATSVNGAVSIGIDGDIEMLSIKEFNAQLTDALPDEFSAIEIDMDKVGYIDSSGIAAIMNFIRNNRENSKRVAVVKINQRILEVFRLMNF